MTRSGRREGCASIALPQWRRCDFLPLGFAHSSRRQESRCPAILRCAAAMTGASSIACGLLIAIETAMVAGSDSEYLGDIFTLSLRAKNVRIVAVSRTNENAPSHRIYVDQVDYAE
jgi:hypothetical protein